MVQSATELISAMQMLENPEQRKVLMGFFKTGKGQYGEGDPRTALRYAIEKMEKDEREYWMNKK